MTTLNRITMLAFTCAFSIAAPIASAQTLDDATMRNGLAASIASCGAELGGAPADQRALERARVDVIDPARPSVTFNRAGPTGPEFLGDPTPRTIYQPVGETESCSIFLFQTAASYPSTLQLTRAILEQDGWTKASRDRFEKGSVALRIKGNTTRGLYHRMNLIRTD